MPVIYISSLDTTNAHHISLQLYCHAVICFQVFTLHLTLKRKGIQLMND